MIVSQKTKTFIAAAAAALIIGCGGTGGNAGLNGGNNGGGGGGNQGRLYPGFILANSGIVQVAFLGGQGRRATGSTVAVISDVTFQNGVDTRIPSGNEPPISSLSVVLDEYHINTGEISVPFNGEVTKSFTEYPFAVQKLQTVNADGSVTDIAGNNPAITVSNPFDLDLKVHPGRYSAIQIRLDDTIIFNDSTNGPTLNEDLFANANYDDRNGKTAIRGFFSDYVAFDIHAMSGADRPNVSSGSTADQIHFSGDGIAISRGLGASSSFELLDPITIKSGKLYLGVNLGTDKTTNTYLLDDKDPSNSKVTALAGVWRDYKTVIQGTQKSTMVMFPSNLDGLTQQVVIYSENGSGNIIAMWQGQVDYNSDQTEGKFKVWPLSTVASANPDPNSAAIGKVSGLQLSNGVIKAGSWVLTSNAPAGWPFAAEGTFGVLRK